DADIPDDVHAQPDQGQRVRSLALAPVTVANADSRSRGRSEHRPADHADQQDPEQHSHQAKVELHVAIENVAELVADHPLQLVAGEAVDGASSEADYRIVRVVPGGEGVDPVLAIEYVNRWDGTTRGQCHLLDHIERPALARVASIGIDQATPEHLR